MQIIIYICIPQVCRNWYEAFYLPQVWSTFVIDDQTLTRAKFNYYSGWQYVLDHFRTQNCLARIGNYIRGLDFRPVHSFNNLYQFMTLIAWYMEQVSINQQEIDGFFFLKKIHDFCRFRTETQTEKKSFKWVDV